MVSLEKIQSIDLRGAQVVVGGGSNGIGRSLALLYASQGASVAILGRTKSAGEAVVQDLEQAAKNGRHPESKARFAFFQADLSLVKSMKSVTAEITKWAGEKGIQYIFQTQGVAPVAKPEWTSESVEVSFAIQALSRFAIPYLLSASGALKETATVVNIGMAGQGGKHTPSPADIDLSIQDHKTPAGFFERNHNTSTVIDCHIKEWSTRHPQGHIYHLWPGFVRTDVISRSSNAPWWLRGVSMITSSISCLSRSPEEYAAVVAHIVSGGEDPTTSLAWNEKPSPIPLAAASDDTVLRKAIWNRLVDMVETL